MTDSLTTYPSGFSTGFNSTDRPFVDPVETIGTPGDSPASDVDDENSMFSLAKGIMAGLGFFSGSSVVNPNSRFKGDMLSALGSPEDEAATSTASGSAIAYLKGILATASGA